MRVARNLILTYILIIACIVGVLVGLSAPKTVYASDLAYDDTYVIDDLFSGSDFVAEDFSSSNINEVQFVTMAEYCYSYYDNTQDNYGLYFYVYNGTDKEIVENSVLNKVQISTTYNDEGEPSNYNKYDLICTSTSTGSLDKMFYKFRVNFTEDDKSDLLDTLNRDSRQYSVSGIELLFDDDINATDVGIALKYTYSGYASGYDSKQSETSSLVSTYDEVKTVSLDVNHTYYRSYTNDADDDTQAQLNSVYFSLPNEIEDLYDRLYSITAEWFEYRSKPIFLTENDTVYDDLLPYLGVDIGSTYGNGPSYGFSENCALQVYLNNAGVYESSWTSSGSNYNVNYDGSYYPWSSSSSEDISQLDWMFLVDDVESEEELVSSEEVQAFALAQSEGATDLINGKYASSLFTTDVGSGRTADYNKKTITADDTYDIDELVISTFLFIFQSSSVETSTIKAIQDISIADFYGSDEDISKRLLVAEEDVDALYDYVIDSSLSDKTTYLFRFADSEYYCADADNINASGASMDQSADGLFITKNKNALIVEENVYLDFDIIEYAYEKDGVQTTYACVSDPVDIFSALTGEYVPEEDNPWWWLELLIMLIITIFLIVIFWPVLLILFKFIGIVWKIITWPFKVVFQTLKGDKK